MKARHWLSSIFVLCFVLGICAFKPSEGLAGQFDVTSLTVERFDLQDPPQGQKGFKKVVLTLVNRSDKDIQHFEVMLRTGSDGRSGMGVGGPDPRAGILRAHSSTTFERVIQDGGEIKPVVRAVVFSDGSFEGDEFSSKAYLIRREEFGITLKRYEQRLLDLDLSATRAQDAAKIHDDLLNDLKEFLEIDSLPPAKKEERFDRLRLQIKRGVLNEILTVVNGIIAGYKQQTAPNPESGRTAIESLRSRYSMLR